MNSLIENIDKLHATVNNCKITVNAHSYTIITAHQVK